MQHPVQRFKITILSLMLVGDTTGIGEWGFAALRRFPRSNIQAETAASISDNSALLLGPAKGRQIP